jgi:RNA polymerase sigma-70 factor (ECF subfamily)
MNPHAAEDSIMAVYRDTIDALYTYAACHSGGDRSLAEDVTQETWLRAVREWRRTGPPDKPLAWLITVARNLIVSYYRRRRPVSLETVPAGGMPAAPDGRAAADAAEAHATIARALGRLSPEQARLLEAFHLDDRDVAEIAEGQGLTARAVEGRLRRARQRLRREVEAVMGIGGHTR